MTCALIIGLSSCALAFSGQPTPIPLKFANSDLVFEGTVTSIETDAVTRTLHEQNGAESARRLSKITFDVHRTWKGRPDSSAAVLTMHQCGTDYEIGSRYVIFGRLMSDFTHTDTRITYDWRTDPVSPVYQASTCNEYVPIDRAAEALAYLQTTAVPLIESNTTIDVDRYNERIEAAVAAGEDWPRSPTTIAFALLGDDTQARETRVHVARHGIERSHTADIELLRDGLADDSIRGDWHRLYFRRLKDGTWRLQVALRAYRCSRGSNPDVYTAEICP